MIANDCIDLNNLIEQYKIAPIMLKSSKLEQIQILLIKLNEIPPQLISILKNLIEQNTWYEQILALEIIKVDQFLIVIIYFNKKYKQIQGTIKINCEQFTQIFFENSYNLLNNNDKRVQDLCIEIIDIFQGQKENQLFIDNLFKSVKDNLQISLKPTSEYSTQQQITRSKIRNIYYKSKGQLLEILLNSEPPSKQNRQKIIEPMFQCNYQYTNDKDIMIQGILGSFSILAKQYPNSDDNLQLIIRCFHHQNKYVRRTAVEMILDRIHKNWDISEFKLIVEALYDESLEVRKKALSFYSNLDTYQNHVNVIQEESCIPLLINCHMDNLIEQSQLICQRLFDKQPNPILGIASFVIEYFLEKVIMVLNENSLHRYYQIRCAAFYTLYSILMIMKENQLDTVIQQQITKVILNGAFYEQDPQVRLAALKSLSGLVRYQKIPDSFIQNLFDCASFHMNDTPFECKETSCIILCYLFNHNKQQGFFNLIEEKVIMIKNREQVYLDYIGDQSEINNVDIQKQIQQLGGKDQLIDKHIWQQNLAFALLFKHFTKLCDWQQNVEFLYKFLQNINYILSQKFIYSDYLMEQKYQTYLAIAEVRLLIFVYIKIKSLESLKQIKRLPIKILDESEILKSLYHSALEYPKLEQIYPIIAKVVGEAILKGRLEQLK